MPFVTAVACDWEQWLRRAEVVAGTPFLVSPRYEYDVTLNSFFQSPDMLCAAATTQHGYARDLAAFLTFLWTARDGTSWREATEADHRAYWYWRRQDAAGPRVAGSAWDREVAAVNKFYKWMMQHKHLLSTPIPQTSLSPRSMQAGWARRDNLDEQRPATYSHDAASERIEWLPPQSYRRWRDVGVRGFTGDGLPDSSFRGRWAARNASFCDLMVRTGLRVSEQAALTLLEIPLGGDEVAYQRFWLPAGVAKGRSARWVYVPRSVAAELNAYAKIDRAEVIAEALAENRYRRVARPMIVEDLRSRCGVRTIGDPSRRRVSLAGLTAVDRSRVFIEGPHGLEPVAFWLGERGLPLTVDRWKKLFQEANDRCRRFGIDERAHAHLLRHTFAVVTLEQLQRGHLNALGGLTADQRGHYTRIFGDPLDWVRRRLGHRSVVTTQIYLHALAELEMDTRVALVPDGWEDPRDIPVSALPIDDERQGGSSSSAR